MVNAPYLPLVLMGFSAIVRSEIPYSDLIGFFVGHMYYYWSDVFPTLPFSHGFKPLETPDWFKNLVEF